MSNIKYVIRRNEFGYNDEWHQTDWIEQGSIQAIYSDKAKAEQAYKQLVVDALYENDMCSYSVGNGDLSNEQYQALEAFVLEKTGQEFDNHDSVPELEFENAFKFAQLSGIVHYQLLEMKDDGTPYYVMMVNNHPITIYSDMSSPIAYSQHENVLYHYPDYTDDWFQERTIEEFFENIPTMLKGSLAELSDTPELLAQFVQSQCWLNYDEVEQKLSLTLHQDEDSFNQLKAFNALLKNPLFRIQQVTLEELAALG